MPTQTHTEQEFLRLLKAELGRAYHDISNPLAIVSGNLELIHELRKSGASAEECMDSVTDAHTAVAAFAEPLQHLMAVRKLVEERLRAMDE